MSENTNHNKRPVFPKVNWSDKAYCDMFADHVIPNAYKLPVADIKSVKCKNDCIVTVNNICTTM